MCPRYEGKPSLNRLADCVFVGCAVEYEVPETLVVPGPAVPLCEVSPGHCFGIGDDAGFQRPAADLATRITETGEEPDDVSH